MRYSTIFFDSDDTLLDFRKSEKKAIAEAFERAGLVYNEEIKASYSEINHGLWKALERGELTTDELLVRRFCLLFERYSYDYDPKSFNDLYFYCLSETDFTVEGAREVLKTLYGRYELDIITNGVGYIQSARLDNADIRKYFRHIFISGEIGANKPSRIFFDHALETVDEKDKSKILVVGDSLTSDIRGAVNAGLDSVYIGNAENVCEIKPTYVISDIRELLNIL